MTVRALIIALLTIFTSATAFSAEPGKSSEGKRLLQEIQRRQKGLVSVSAAFAQTKRTELLDRPIKSSGTFQFKPGVGVRWEYKDSMTVVYDGKVLFVHYIDLNEAEKIYGAGGFAGPLAFDVVGLRNDFEIDARKDDDDIILTLKPKKKMPFTVMTMAFGKGAAFPYMVNISEENGDATEIRFSSIKLGKLIPDSVFVFKPPIGVVVRERSLDQ